MLLSHFLSSIVSPNSRCSLFVPLPTNQPTANFSHATEGVCDESKEKVRSKEMLVEKHKELKKMFSYIIDSTTNNLDKKFLKQEYDSKLKVSYQGFIQDFFWGGGNGWCMKCTGKFC